MKNNPHFSTVIPEIFNRGSKVSSRGLTPSCLKGVRPLQGFVVFLLIFSVLLTGCGPHWKTKFVRKRAKNAPIAQPILVLQPDMKAVLPAADRYREHYAFWKSWHSELLLSLGQIQKRDQRYLAGSLNELRALQGLLTGAPSEKMKAILLEMAAIQDQFMNASPAWKPSSAIRSRLEWIERQVNREFHYSKVKNSLVADPARDSDKT